MSLAADALIIIGLSLDALGAVLIGSVLIRSRREMKSRSSTGARLGGGTDTGRLATYEWERTAGIVGVTLLVLGFALQIWGRLVP